MNNGLLSRQRSSAMLTGCFGWPIKQGVERLQRIPPDAGNLRGWWDASDASSWTITGQGMSRWRDKVQEARGDKFAWHDWIQSTDASRPIMTNRRMGGFAVPDFDGSDDYLLNDAPVYETTPVSWYFVYELDSVASFHVLFGGTTANNTHELRTTGSTWQVVNTSDGVGGMNSAVAIAEVGQASVLSMRDNGSQGWMRNNLAGDTASFSGIGGAGVALGARWAGGVTWDGAIAEILLYSVAHDDRTNLEIHDWLRRKWGTQ